MRHAEPSFGPQLFTQVPAASRVEHWSPAALAAAPAGLTSLITPQSRRPHGSDYLSIYGERPHVFSAPSDLEIARHANRSCDTSRPGLACPGSVPVAPAARVFQRYAARLGRSVAGSIFTEASNPYRRHSRTHRLPSAASSFWVVYLSGEPGLHRAARPGPGSRPSGASPNGEPVRQRCEPVLPFQRWPMR